MLNLKLQRTDTFPAIKTMLTEFRRVQVSRFPIDVEDSATSPSKVRFVDSRFPSNSWRRESCLAMLEMNDYDDKGRPIYKLTSRLIANEKYAAHNDDYFTKSTTDTRKMLKYLREFVKPYTSLEIATRTSFAARETHHVWQEKPLTDFRCIAGGISPNEIAKEVMYLKSIGVEFHTDKFRKIAEEGVELYDEAMRRAAIPFSGTHVFLQPDDSVLVTRMVDGDFDDAGATLYERFDEVPEDIRQQVAMLRMVDGKQFIPEVGSRMNEREFWVQVERGQK